MALPIKAHNPPMVWTVPEAFRTIPTGQKSWRGSRTLFIFGQFGIAPDGRLPAEFAEQATLAMANVEALLIGSGHLRVLGVRGKRHQLLPQNSYPRWPKSRSS